MLHLVLAMATGSSLDDLTYVGMMGIIDPERPNVEKAIEQLNAGGVNVKMITGDAEKTAKAIGNLTKQIVQQSKQRRTKLFVRCF
jgi:P-type E1-E2 ATPase